MPTLHVLTVAPGLPLWLLDHVLTDVEQSLVEAGACRVWIDPGLPDLAVLAELPQEEAQEEAADRC